MKFVWLMVCLYTNSKYLQGMLLIKYTHRVKQIYNITYIIMRLIWCTGSLMWYFVYPWFNKCLESLSYYKFELSITMFLRWHAMLLGFYNYPMNVQACFCLLCCSCWLKKHLPTDMIIINFPAHRKVKSPSGNDILGTGGGLPIPLSSFTPKKTQWLPWQMTGEH